MLAPDTEKGGCFDYLFHFCLSFLSHSICERGWGVADGPTKEKRTYIRTAKAKT